MIKVNGITCAVTSPLNTNQCNKVSFTSNEIKPDSVELSIKKNKKKNSLAIAGATAVAIIGVIFAVRHFRPKNIKNGAEKVTEDIKEIQNTVGGSSTINLGIDNGSNIQSKNILDYLTPEELERIDDHKFVKCGIISPEMKLMFAKIRKLEDEEFIKSAYTLMTKLLGYENCAPELKLVQKDKDRTHAFSKFPGVIKIDTFHWRQGTEFQTEYLNILRHELEHFIQFSTIARTEGYGTNAICEAQAKSVVRRLKIDKDFCNEVYNKPFEELKMDEKEIFDYYNGYYKSKINTSFWEKIIKEKGMIPKNTPDAKKAEEYFNASCNYTAVKKDTKRKLVEDYDNNLLEKRANYEGMWIENCFYAFKSALGE